MVGRSAVVALVVAFVGMFAACGWDWTVVPKAVPSDAGEGGISADGACTNNDQCRLDELCLFEDQRCGAGKLGFCEIARVAKECDELKPGQASFEVCGCDGKVAKNACAVELTRNDISVDGPCVAPPGTVRCGFYFCPSATTYCSKGKKGDVDTYACLDWPCADHSCNCNALAPECSTASCSTDGAGGTTVVCPQ